MNNEGLGSEPQITDDCFCLYLCHFRIQCVYLFRSQPNGNCLFSTFSVALCGDNKYVDGLRFLTSIELYLNSDFYSKHPFFISLISKHSKVYQFHLMLFIVTKLRASWFKMKP